MFLSDVHFDVHDKPMWQAVLKFIKHIQPDEIALAGDIFDFGMLGRHPQEVEAPIFAIDQIRAGIAEINTLRKNCGRLVLIEGNHDERWGKWISGAAPHVLRGALGLSLYDQCIAQGMDPTVMWLREGTVLPAHSFAKVNFIHGHNPHGGPFGGGGVNVASNKLNKSAGESLCFGHHHKVQYITRTSPFGKTYYSVANGTLASRQFYARGSDWQWGLTVLEGHPPNFEYATPHPIIIDKDTASFAYGGWVYTP